MHPEQTQNSMRVQASVNHTHQQLYVRWRCVAGGDRRGGKRASRSLLSQENAPPSVARDIVRRPLILLDFPRDIAIAKNYG
jgi:hypothetical protein